MRPWWLVRISAAVFVTAVIGGCSSADGDARAVQTDATQDATAPLESAASGPPADEPIDDAAICTAYGDVLTILENADLGLADGRMQAQEHEGWYKLATRVLDRVPSTGDSAVRSAIADLQQIAPAIAPGAVYEPVGVRSPEWYDAQEVLSAACDDLGVPLAISVFTGG